MKSEKVKEIISINGLLVNLVCSVDGELWQANWFVPYNSRGRQHLFTKQHSSREATIAEATERTKA